MRYTLAPDVADDRLLFAAVLMDKGIIVGVDQETSLRRSLDFAIFRIITTVRCPLLPACELLR